MKEPKALEMQVFYGCPEQVIVNAQREVSTMIFGKESDDRVKVLAAVISPCDFRLLMAVTEMAASLNKIARIHFNKSDNSAQIVLSNEKTLEHQFFDFADFGAFVSFLTMLTGQEFLNEEESASSLLLVKKDFRFCSLGSFPSS